MIPKDAFRFDLQYKSYTLIDNSHLLTASKLMDSFLYSKIVVLDFALKREEALQSQAVCDSRGRYLMGRYSRDGKVLLNVDHHNDEAGKTVNFSTTHQVISAKREHLLDADNQDQITVINHDDTDSVAALLLATHAHVPQSVNTLFAEAATAADHTGEPNAIVNIVDTMYKLGDLDALVILLNAFLHHEKLCFPTPQLQEKFERYSNQPERIREYLESIVRGVKSPHGKGSYDQMSGILRLEPKDKAIDTIRVLPIVRQLQLPVTIIMTSELKDKDTNFWKISLRSGPSFPAKLSLMQVAKKLKLEKYGYGGRLNAGGIGRHRGEKTLTPDQLFALLAKRFVRQDL
ncbi:MAG: hypothetical protein ABI758_00320 [Candidatus Woesebacteria bacterium]